MSKKLITTISLVFALAVGAAAPTALAEPPNGWPTNPGVCNMLHVANSAVGFAGMDNSSHGQGFDNMVDHVIAAGCL